MTSVLSTASPASGEWMVAFEATAVRLEHPLVGAFEVPGWALLNCELVLVQAYRRLVLPSSTHYRYLKETKVLKSYVAPERKACRLARGTVP